MNKQTVIGFVLIGVILFGFTWYNGKQQKQFQEQQRIEDSITRANMPAPVEPVLPIGGAGIETNEEARALVNDPLGEMLGGARGGRNADGDNMSHTFTVENDIATYEFSTRGGMISDVVLKNYKKYGGDALHLWKPGTESFDVAFFLRRGDRDAQVNTRDFNFTTDAVGSNEWREGEVSKTVSMRLPVDSTAYVEFVYTIPRSDYMIGCEVRFVGMEGRLSNQSSFDVEWSNTSLQNEKGFDNENNYTSIAYNYPGEKGIENLGIQRAGGSKSENEPARIKWVAFKQQFFSSFIIADEAFQGAEMDLTTSQPGEGTVKKFHAHMSVPMERDRDAYGFRFYFGPNEYKTLRAYDLSLDRIIFMGAMSFGGVTRLLILPIFNWLGGHITSIGLIILLLTLFIKLIILPLTFTSYKSSAKMRVIKPEIDEINAKFPDQADAMKKQQATMELYRRAGINPLAGCLPMLIQFPIIIAAFRFFPVAIELRGQSLWWAEDLSSYDSIIDLGFKIPFYGDHVSLFALLMAASMFVYSWLNFKMQPAQAGMPGMKFMMLYLMPIMMLFWFNNYSSGLCFYYLLGNLFTIAQIYGVRAFIDEGKLRKKMLETPRKEKKKSGFMQRLEEAQKAQMAAARAQQQAQQKSRGDVPPPVRGSRGNVPGTGKKKR